MPTARRIIKRVLLGLLAFVVLVVVGTVVFLHTDSGRNVIRAQVEQRMNAAFTGGASIGTVEGSPFGELVARDVVINGPDGKPAITIEWVKLELGILALLSRHAVVSGLEAEGVDIDLRRDVDGELQITRLLAPGPESGWSVHIPDLAIRRARVAFDTGREVLHFDELALTGAVTKPYGAPLDASVSLRGSWRERGVPLELDAIVHQDRELVTFQTLSASAGEVHVDGTDVRIASGPLFGGTLVIRAPRAAVAKLVPEIALPADVVMAVEATPVPARGVTHLDLEGQLGRDDVRASFDADLPNRRASGIVSTSEVDLAQLTGGRVVAHAGGSVLFDLTPGAPGKLPVGTAVIHATGTYRDLPRTRVTAALWSDGERVATKIGATNRALTATLGGELRKLGDAITLDRGTVVASSRDPAAASGGKAPLHGTLRVNLTASGALAPRPELAVTGKIHGTRLRMEDLKVAKLSLAIDARRLPSRPLGKAELEAEGVERGDLFLRELKLTAANRSDGKIQVSMRSRPRQDPWLVEADALVTPGDVVTIDLQRHRVRAGTGTDWIGTTGHIAISKHRIELRDLGSVSRDGALAIAGVLHRGGARDGDLVAKLDARQFQLGTLAERYAGNVDAHVEVQRTNGRFAGVAELHAKGITLDPTAAMVDADATIRAAAGKLTVDARAGSPQLGTGTLALDLDAPADIADAAAWKRLGRSAIRTGRIAFQGINLANAAKLAGLEGEYTGRLDGDLRISASTTGGLVQLRGLMAPALRSVGPVSGDLQVSQSALDELTPSLTARVDGIGGIEAQARLGMPDRLFDPAAWRRLGRGAIRNLWLRAENIELDPAQLDRLGITTYVRGRANIYAEISEAAADARLSITLRNLRGSPISQPIDADLLAVIDGKGTTTNLEVMTREHRRDGTREFPIGPRVQLVKLTGTLPLTIDEVVADPRGALAKPLQLTATASNMPAKHLLAVFGRNEITAGTIDGTITVAGTLADPTVRAKLVGSELHVPPGPGGRPIKTVRSLVVDATWDGQAASIVIDGVQDQGSLHVTATGSPDALADARVTLQASQFDLLPLLAFAPGPVGGSAGRLDANLTVHGLDPKTAKLAGELHLSRARIPIAPSVGTLRRAKIDLVVVDHDVRVAIDGRLGGGTVNASGTIALDGASPTGGNATVKIRGASPIGVVEPTVDADATVKLRREPGRWIADVVVTRGKVVVPKERGTELSKPGAPSDMVFITGERITRRPMKKEVPTRPIIVANIRIMPTYIESEELRGFIKGQLTATADFETVGLVGTIEAERGNLDLFGHRYQVERAAVRFDGSLDPLLDIKIAHDFPEVTTITQVRGRLSNPELIMSSNPGTYSQGQLLGYLLGGRPDGDPGDSRERATAAGASYVANEIGKYVKGALPIDLDVLRYEHSTATTSAAITVGTWLTRNLFLAYRQRLEARPDENSGEGEIEYWISRRFVVEAIVGDRNYNGVDVVWRKRY